MASLKEVKERIGSVTSTQQITKAMKMVAAAKLRRAQEKITQMRPYSQKLTSIIDNVSSTLGPDVTIGNPYSVEREVENVLVVLITSDKGLCGAFNSNVIKATKSLMTEKYSAQNEAGNLELLTIGSKGDDVFRRLNANVNSTYRDLLQDLSFEKAKEVAEYAMSGFLDGKYDAVEVVYNEFINVVTQETRTDLFLPAVKKEDETKESGKELDFIFEPSKEEIISELIPKSMKIEFYTKILDSNASEQGSRMSAMDKATDNAGELIKELTLLYNQSRQAAITTEILEIVSGAEALSQSS
ncbi:ATP synthase F1 subunit gamma [Sediminitomix flava]|uniref:ATP synthase gamma chain n=1 Tax=Sediminitomix flava TaxID=379075 RepID=A0A315ZEZ4_SEDFL|nr:ATP synthase F1 subunit gamma [Sediminitomix flava]PWJ44091.1 ATP synthase F1 subcomplex gamma subunit [Sediminitomix flava]